MHPLWIRHAREVMELRSPPLLWMVQEREQIGSEVSLSAVSLGGQQGGRAVDGMRAQP